MASELWRIALVVPEAAVAAAADLVGDQAVAVSTFELSEGGDWLVEATCQGRPERAPLIAGVAVLAAALGFAEPVLELEPLPPIDWVTRVHQDYPPLRIGRFFIRGSHYRGPVPGGALVLTIDAATAFGSGEHGSTRGCLVVLDRLLRRRSLRQVRALDMGCGSAILALAIAKASGGRVDAIDIDAESVRVAGINARLNGVGPRIRIAGGNGYDTPLARRGRRYRLIAANILARPLARMAGRLAGRLEKGGFAVLSGLLARQEPLVRTAHRKHGLRLVGRQVIDGWATLVMRR